MRIICSVLRARVVLCCVVSSLAPPALQPYSRDVRTMWGQLTKRWSAMVTASKRHEPMPKGIKALDSNEIMPLMQVHNARPQQATPEMCYVPWALLYC